MATEKQKAFHKALGQQTKKGSTYKTKDGTVKERSDFQRGVAAGRIKQIGESAAFHKNRTKK